MPDLSMSEAFLYGVVMAVLLIGLCEWFSRMAGEATDVEEWLQ